MRWLIPAMAVSMLSLLALTGVARTQGSAKGTPCGNAPFAEQGPKTLSLTLYELPPPAPPPPPVLPRPRRVKAKQRPQYEIEMEMPGPERLFCAEAEQTVRENIRRNGERRHIAVEFPADATPENVTAGPHAQPMPPAAALLVPGVVCYQPLYFEDKNTERYGWYIPVLQPLISTEKFYFQTLLLPYQLMVQPPCICECNSGYPSPGDPVPYLLYRTPCGWSYHLNGPSVGANFTVGGQVIAP